MKFFIVGVKIDFELRTLEIEKICDKLIGKFPIFVNLAKDKVGKDAIIVIVLQEYALTQKPISNARKKECLALLQNALKLFPNTILVPGSFSSYDQLKNAPEKRKKIKRHYNGLNHISLFRRDNHFSQEFDNYKSKIKNPNISYLENSTYTMTKDISIKHKKSFPFNERFKLPSSLKSNFIYYIGTDNPVNVIQLEKNKIDFGVLICREHATNKVTKIKESSPLLQVIISDTIYIDKDKLYGALNIHMDSMLDLKVYQNTEHSQASSVESVTAVCVKIANDPAKEDVKYVAVKKIACKLPENRIAKILKRKLENVDEEITSNKRCKR